MMKAFGGAGTLSLPLFDTVACPGFASVCFVTFCFGGIGPVGVMQTELALALTLTEKAEQVAFL